MIKKIIEISHAGTYLSIKHDQLVVKRKDQQDRTIPCEDIGVLLVDHAGVTYTHSVFTCLLRHNAAVVLCNGQHHPAGLLLPVETNTLQSEKYQAQIKADRPTKKRLWKQIVRAKILHQAKVISDEPQTSQFLKGLSKKVRSGDPDNIEAQAARKFWAVYFQGLECGRLPDGPPPNNLLNYGYTVMRAAVARAVCSAGLLPTFGIHHHNRYNAYCLADDMSEPFRGYVETRVREICRTGIPEMNQHTKARLLELLYETVDINGSKGPLMVGLHRTMASLVRCLEGTQKKLELPKL